MRRVGIGWVLAAMLVAATFGSRVAADVIPAPPACSAWQTARARGSRHSGFECVARTCRADRECGAGSACEAHRVCMVERTSWESSGGPCRDQDGDGQCDGRHQVTRTVESGPCDARGRCVEGRCTTKRTCAAPGPPPG